MVLDAWRRKRRAYQRVEEYVGMMSSRMGFYMAAFASVDEMEQSGQLPSDAYNVLARVRSDMVRKLGHDPESRLQCFLRRTDNKISICWWVSWDEGTGYKGLKRYDLSPYEDTDVELTETNVEDGFTLLDPI